MAQTLPYVPLESRLTNAYSILGCYLDDLRTDPVLQKYKRGETLTPKETEEVEEFFYYCERMVECAKKLIDMVHKKYNIPYDSNYNPNN